MHIKYQTLKERERERVTENVYNTIYIIHIINWYFKNDLNVSRF